MRDHRGKNNPAYLHGMSNTPEHQTWGSMLSRCHNPNHRAYKHYGGRGIFVCERWRKSFQSFLDDVGFRPTPQHSIDRIDNNAGYEIDNVRWATVEEQRNNKRNNRIVVYRGQSMTLTMAMRTANCATSIQAICYRLRTGWSVERALETPTRHYVRAGNAIEARIE